MAGNEKKRKQLSADDLVRESVDQVFARLDLAIRTRLDQAFEALKGKEREDVRLTALTTLSPAGVPVRQYVMQHNAGGYATFTVVMGPVPNSPDFAFDVSPVRVTDSGFHPAFQQVQVPEKALLVPGQERTKKGLVLP